MRTRLLEFLRCPECGGRLEVETFAASDTDAGSEVTEGALHCQEQHWYPVVRGIPRMLPDAMDDHWPELEKHFRTSTSPAVTAMLDAGPRGRAAREYDRRTRANFSLEWEHHQAGDKTWGIDLEHRVRGFFLDPLRIPSADLEGMVMLDAGCGNGSQSVAYTEFGVEVIAIDVSSGVEHGNAYRHTHPGARPELVHFVQGDLVRPPLAAGRLDLIHSAGVLHHTPNTEKTFRGLCSRLAPEGTFYVWVYSYEPVVTPVVNALRAVTTRIPAPAFARVAEAMAVPFQLFCVALDRLGVRSYPRWTRREAALALMDIFGAPYAHYHSFAEVAAWYRDEGFDEVWECNPSRRGFGVCGRRRAPSGRDREVAPAVSAADGPPSNG